MKFETFNLLNVGVGGQGVIRTIQIIAEAALRSNYNVRTAETHGMAQRGGSVSSFLRFGSNVNGPLVPKGHLDVMLAFELLESVRNINYIGPNTFSLMNDMILYPSTHNSKNDGKLTPREIQQFWKRKSKKVHFIDAHGLAIKAGNPRTLNVVMLGFLSGAEILPIKRDLIENSILNFIPSRLHEINLQAFHLGMKEGEKIKRCN